MRIKLKVIIIAIVLLIFNIDPLFAGWVGPQDAVNISWGNGAGRVGLESSDSGDNFPSLDVVTSAGEIVLTDTVNNKQLVFSSTGILIKEITWTLENSGGGRSIYSIPEYSFSTIEGYTSEGQIYTSSVGKYYLVSSTGQILQSYDKKPVDLGVIKEQKISEDQYKVTVTYPDKEWVIVGGGACAKYVRDVSGNLYCAGEEQVIKYSSSGKEIGRITMPVDNIEEIDFGPSQEPQYNVIEEYGFAFVAPNGDVYTWKRTPDTYSIIKWTWQDDPKDVGGNVQ